jgi:uroporphyrinogen III methyltransferase/synthase
MTVYLVGAGPGDPGLITVRGLDLVRRADVLVLDRLAGDQLPLEARPDCLLIDAGKAPGKVAMTQAETNACLVEHGLTGKLVVRLKGGDPFVFGRGSEEAEALHAAGVDYEVVPGLSSSIAAPGAAGIPVLLIHGDTHLFRFDQPFSLNRSPIPNLSRLIVPGANDMRAVRVGVEPGSAQPWSVRLLQSRP